MHVDALDHQARSRIFDRFFAETSLALVQVFDKSEQETAEMMDALRRKFAEAPKEEQDMLLHDDPATLAAELAEVSYSQIDEGRLRAFHEQRRPDSFELEADQPNR